MKQREQNRIGFTQRAGYTWRRVLKYKHGYFFALPFTLIFVVFTLIPVLMAVFYSFTSFNALQPAKWIWLENYRQLILKDSLFLTSFKNTLLFAAITGPVGYLLSLLLAWFLNDFSPGVRSVLTLLFYAPTLANIYYVWQLIFSSDAYGILNSYLMKVGILTSPVAWLTDEKYIVGTLIFILLWSSLGTSFLVLIAGFQNVDRTLFEAAAVDGIRNRWQELWYITLPYIRPQLLFAAVTSITGAFNIGPAIDILCGTPSTNYVAWTMMHHLNDSANVRLEMGYACTIATVLFVLMVAANRFFQNLIGKVGQ